MKRNAFLFSALTALAAAFAGVSDVRATPEPGRYVGILRITKTLPPYYSNALSVTTSVKLQAHLATILAWLLKTRPNSRSGTTTCHLAWSFFSIRTRPRQLPTSITGFGESANDTRAAEHCAGANRCPASSAVAPKLWRDRPFHRRDRPGRTRRRPADGIRWRAMSLSSPGGEGRGEEAVCLASHRSSAGLDLERLYHKSEPRAPPPELRRLRPE